MSGTQLAGRAPPASDCCHQMPCCCACCKWYWLVAGPVIKLFADSIIICRNQQSTQSMQYVCKNMIHQPNDDGTGYNVLTIITIASFATISTTFDFYHPSYHSFLFHKQQHNIVEKQLHYPPTQLSLSRAKISVRNPVPMTGVKEYVVEGGAVIDC